MHVEGGSIVLTGPAYIVKGLVKTWSISFVQRWYHYNAPYMVWQGGALAKLETSESLKVRDTCL